MSDDKLFVSDGLLPIPFEDIRLLALDRMFIPHDRYVESRVIVMSWLDAWWEAEKQGCRPAIMLPPRVRESFSIDYEDEY